MPKVAPLAFAALMIAAGQARADCFEDAAARQYIHPLLLRALADVEVPSGDNKAINKNTNGTEDVCRMQVNSVNFPTLNKFGITRQLLLDNECTCIHSGAYLLSRFIARYGNTWAAVAAYNAGKPITGSVYAQKVYARFLTLTGTPAPASYTPVGPTFMEE